MMLLNKKRICYIILVALLFSSLGLYSSQTEAMAATGSYVVKYMEVGTDNQIYPTKTVENLENGSVVQETAPEIGGFLYPQEGIEDVTVGKDREVVFYYYPDTLTTVDPAEVEEMESRDIMAPVTSWNIEKKGPYEPDTGGKYYSNVLYTNEKLWGKTNYTVKIHNSNDVAMKVTIRTSTKVYSTINLQAGSSWYVPLTMPTKRTKFYIKFKSETNYLNFYGEIS